MSRSVPCLPGHALLVLAALTACDPGAFDERPADRHALDASMEPGMGSMDASTTMDASALDAQPDAHDAAASCDSGLQSCGGCDVRCVAPTDGVPACEQDTCVAYAPRVGTADPQKNLFRGSANAGGPASSLCGADEVLTGFESAFDFDTPYGLAARCAPLQMAGSHEQPSLRVGASHVLPMVGAENLAWTPPVVSFACPEGKVVSSLKGSLWYQTSEAMAAKRLSLKNLTLTCSTLSVDGAGLFTLSHNESVLVGNDVGTVQSTFADSCSAGSVVVGAKFRAGAWIDAIETHCGALSVQREAGAMMLH